jgi:hypothetical protein
LALTPIGSPPRVAPTRVDTPDVDTGVPAGTVSPQSADIAQAELRGWIAGRAAERRAQQDAGPPAAVAPQAGATAPVQVVASTRAAFDRLEDNLKTMPESMREALVSALKSGGEIPPQFQPIVDLARQTNEAVQQQFASLPPDQQASVGQLLASDNAASIATLGHPRWEKAEQILDALPPSAQAPAAQAPAAQAPAAQAPAAQAPAAQAPAAQAPVAPLPVGPNLGAALQQLGQINNPTKVDALIAAAKADGMNVGQFVDQINSGKGPIAESVIPRMNIPQLQQLGMYLPTDPANAKQYMQRLNGLQAIVDLKTGTNKLPKNPNLMSGGEMQQLLASGRDPLDIARALVNNTGNPPRSAMTLDALNILEGAMLPTKPLTDAQRAEFNKLVDGLAALEKTVPPTAVQLPAQQAPAAARQPAVAGVQPNGAPFNPNGAPQDTLSRLGQQGAPGVAQQPVVGAGVPQAGYAPPGYAPPGYQGYMPPGVYNPNSNRGTGMAATIGSGFMPTGNTALDLANSIANMPAHSQAEQALLDQIQDPQQRAMQELQMFMQKQSLIATTLSNIANMRHEMMKTVANNLRA